MKNRSLVLVILSFLSFDVCTGQNPALFDNDEILEFTIKCDIKALMRDRDVESDYHQATITYQESFDVPLRIKTRGHFRKMSKNCQYPPILLNFAKSSTPENSIFNGQDKTKLVTPCRGEEYVVHEYLVYKLYNLLTPRSFKARLVKVTFHDQEKDKVEGTHIGILLEEEEQMAERNMMESLEMIGLEPERTKKEDFLRMAVFQFMIGNTDWSVQYQQNIKLITNAETGRPITVPYDFDHAGIVRAPYANPAPELKLTSTLHRRYRGYCIEEMEQFASVLSDFNSLKDEFYALYSDNPLLDERYKKRTLKFLDEFYETINDPKKVEREFTYPCLAGGTGNVIIRGLKEH